MFMDPCRCSKSIRIYKELTNLGKPITPKDGDQDKDVWEDASKELLCFISSSNSLN